MQSDINIDTINIGDSALTNIAVFSPLNSVIVDDFTVGGSITNAASSDLLIDYDPGIILDADDNGTIV